MSDDEQGDFSDWQEDEQETKCLFCAEKRTGSQSLLQHMITEHKFDLVDFRKTHKLDFYASIRLVNYIRSEVNAGVAESAILINLEKETHWKVDEKYLKPTLEDDPLLFDMEDIAIDENDNDNSAQSLQSENEMLKSKLAEMTATMQQMREAMTRITFGDDEKNGENTTLVNKKETEKKQGLQIRKDNEDDGYFANYSDRHIHEVMLKDTVRTCAYRDFMYKNKHLFAGKIVLDIGCGTGILCMFAARAGAKKVIGIDRADIIDKAREIVEENKLGDIITFVKSKVEEAVLPVEKVDLIVSEWMGYFLLYESMLPSVLYARDKWLTKGGGVYPNRAIMYLAGIECTQQKASKVGYWKDVYGFDMSVLIDDAERFARCGVETIQAKSIITQQETIATFDCMTCKEADLEFTHEFAMKVEKQESLDAFAVWFDTDFDHNCTERVVLPTAPVSETSIITHWYQTVFHLHEPLKVSPGDVVKGTIKAHRGKEYHREYKVEFNYCLVRTETPNAEPKYFVQEYTV